VHLSSLAPSQLGITPCSVGFPSAPTSRRRSSASHCSRFGFPSALHSPSPRRRSFGLSSTPSRPGLRRVPVESSNRGARLRTLPAAADGSRRPHFSAPASAMSASTSPALRALRQLRLPRRPTCPPLRSSSKCFRAIHRRPDPVRWSALGARAGRSRVTPSEEAGSGPQAAGPHDRPARAPGRSWLLVAGRPAQADGPRRLSPAKKETIRWPAALPASLSPCRW
jgi:hypothetical protein